MEIPAIVEKITFRRDKFAILACNLNPYSNRYNADLERSFSKLLDKKWASFTVVVDTMSEHEKPEGQGYVFVGEITYDPKRGSHQYKATGYYQDTPSSEEELFRLLKNLPNIKESRAREILTKYSVSDVVSILDNNPRELLCIRGITEKRLTAIISSWEEIRFKRELYEWFVKCNIPLKLADKAYDKWKNSAKKKLSENPYLLTELPGIGFLTADVIAHKMNENVNPKFRLTCCMEYVLKDDFDSNGNLCTPYTYFKDKVLSLLGECDGKLGVSLNPSFAKAIPHIIKDPLSQFTAVKVINDGLVFVYLTKIWEREKFIGEILFKRTLKSSEFSCSDSDIKNAEGNISFFLGKPIELDGTQKVAIKSVFENRITVITGGGGTGKSTICRCIYDLARKKGLTMAMMSPTGKAAKVLSERTGGAATTIHRALKISPDCCIPTSVITQDILLVDEISMSGIDTMYALMVAVENNPRINIVFVGDKNQLPSVSAGNFLSDIISSKCANVVTLDKIHRQDENSYISLIANDVSNGKVTPIPPNATDITWYDLNDDKFESDIIQFFSKYLDNGNEIDDIQFLSPMKKGICGVFKLNEIIQKYIAKRRNTTKSLERDFNIFYEKDKVIQISNNYEKEVFNGDMGVITDLGERIRDPSVSDQKEKFVTVDFLGEIKTYYGKEIDELLLAWAITVHKFQGSQAKNIVMIMSSEASIMMNKELVYTGFTRAEKNLYIFGKDHMYRLAPSRSSIKKRFTNLNNVINEFVNKNKLLQVV